MQLEDLLQTGGASRSTAGNSRRGLRPSHLLLAGALALAAGLGATSCGGGGGGGGDSGGEQGGGLEPGDDAGDLQMSAHALRRISFGPTPAELAQVVEVGVTAWVEDQLHPAGIPENPELTRIVNLIPYPTTPYGSTLLKDLVRYQLAHAIYSRRQLREQMTHFWDVHFNTDYRTIFNKLGGPAQKRTTYLEWKENELFRENAFGAFHDLLLASATSPNMILYLDNVSNTKGSPNENYAREVVELFTMGVDNGYTEEDVEELARCFTGWSICEVQPQDYGNPFVTCNSNGQPVWSFRFKPGQHDEGAKTIFAGTPHELHLPARSGNAGIQDGYEVLEHLAGLPQTAEFVSGKLIQRFVDDDPPPALLAACREEWLATGGDIREVLRVILSSNSFRQISSRRWNKVRTPIEALVATTRALEGTVQNPSNLDALRFPLDGVLNHQLFRWATPDGYPEFASAQTGTGKLLGSLVFKRFIYDSPNVGLRFDLRQTLIDHDVPRSDPEAIVDFFAGVLFPGNMNATERQLALDFLTTDESGAPAALAPGAPDYDDRLHLFAVYLSSFPQVIQQ